MAMAMAIAMIDGDDDGGCIDGDATVDGATMAKSQHFDNIGGR